jgi:hypothetical protein
MVARHNPHADCVPLTAKGAEGAEQLENAAGQAFCRLTALAGMLARLQELARSRDPEAVEGAAPDAMTMGGDAETLLRYFDSRPWDSVRVAANGTSRPRPRACLGSGVAGDA